MGEEIANTKFSAEIFEEFRNRVDLETALLHQWISEGRMRSELPSVGCELEAWIVDQQSNPSASNDKLLKALNNDLVVEELAKFNIELNTDPLDLAPGFLQKMHADLTTVWNACEKTAQQQDANMVMIGILPTVRQADLCLQNQSAKKRYRALNEQIFRLRSGNPLHLDISGREHLQLDHHDVMIEAAATSFQLHYKVDVEKAVRAYNASRVLSAPMVAMAANSPYLFGQDLWAETRIPLFEQAVLVGGSNYANRVTFGLRHISNSIMDCFEANRTRFPALLPELKDVPPEELAHLRMHNGTVWRWNRPLVGFDADGAAHFRIEHRVASAGPSMKDMIANSAFYYGCLTALLEQSTPIEDSVSNWEAAHNFYECAEKGLDAELEWQGKKGIGVQIFCIEYLLPLAKQGLLSLGYDKDEAEYWFSILHERVKSGQNGATWQRQWVAKHGKDFNELVAAYRHQQAMDIPVHTWSLK